MAVLLKNYIKLLIESVIDNEKKYADIITSKNQEKINQKFYGDELNRIVTELNNSYGIYGLNDTLKKNGYSLIGQGAYRDVWSRPDVDFVIKVNNTYNDTSNQFEYNTYFNLDRFADSNDLNTDDQYYDVSIYPKLYGYDKNFGNWIIFEKVNMFNQQNELYTFFPLLTKQIENAYNILCKDLNISNNFLNMSAFEKNEILLLILTKFVSIQELTGHYDNNSHNTNLIFESFLEIFHDYGQRYYSRLPPLHIFKAKAHEIFKRRNFIFQITPDIGYILKRLRENPTYDFHEGNFGYRNIKNPNKPWESIVIIDYQF